MKYQDINAETIDRWVDNGWQWGTPISHEEYVRAINGDWKVHLTTIRYVPADWFPKSLKGVKILGLASGGGQQMPLFAAAGADVTVFDYSPRQLEKEKEVAQREGYSIHIVRGDMTEPLPFEDASFDLIFHPVSNCYVKEVKPIFKECYRVLRNGGIFLGGYDLGINYVFDEKEEKMINRLPFDPTINEDQRKQLEETDSGMQFSHTLEEQIGGQLEAGFVLTDLFEDYNEEGKLAEFHVPSFIATRAIKPEK